MVIVFTRSMIVKIYATWIQLRYKCRVRMKSFLSRLMNTQIDN